MQKLTVGSFFSGIGGLDKGLEDTGGFEVRYQVENDPYALTVLKKNWPGERDGAEWAEYFISLGFIEGHAAGALQMRERAAKETEQHGDGHCCEDCPCGYWPEAIRALPLEKP